MAVLSVTAANVAAAAERIQRFEFDEKLLRSGAVLVEGFDLVQTSQLVSRKGGDLRRQVNDLFQDLESQLKSVGSGPEQAVRLNVYLSNSRIFDDAVKEVSNYVPHGALPAISWVTTSLPVPDALIAIDALAARPAKQDITIVDPSRPGLAVIPAAATSKVFISGQAEKGDGTPANATKLTMDSLKKSLTFVELTLADVVQVKAFIAPMSKSEEVLAEIRAAFAPGLCPPVSLVEWQSPSLPVEIELVAATTRLHADRPVVEYLTPPDMKSSPVFCRITRVQSPALIFVSGLYGNESDPDSEAELRDRFAQTKRLVEAGGSDLNHLVKATYYVSSSGSSQQHNKLRPEYYDPLRPPAASKAIVTGVGRPTRTITWDMIAVPKSK